MTEHEPAPQIRTVIFGEGLLGPTLKGEKQITLRKYRKEAHSFKEGELFVGSFKDGLNILLQATSDTKVTTFGDLTDEQAQEDGFKDAQDALKGMQAYYPDLHLDTELGIIRFEIARIKGVPSIKANEFFTS